MNEKKHEIILEIEEELEKIKNNYDKNLVFKLKRSIKVQYEISGDLKDFWAIVIEGKELNIVRKIVEKPNLKFTFRTSEGFLKYLKKEISELRGWMNEYYIFEGPPAIIKIYYSIIGYPIPNQWT
jgi:hypothetical protein